MRSYENRHREDGVEKLRKGDPTFKTGKKIDGVQNRRKYEGSKSIKQPKCR